MWVALGDDGKSLREDAIGADFQRWDEPGEGSYAAPDARFEHTANYQRTHAISDVLTAVLDAGLGIELFHEFDVTPAPTPWLERGADGLYRFPVGSHRFPVMYSVRARRPQGQEAARR
jgi:hypothetical protein